MRWEKIERSRFGPVYRVRVVKSSINGYRVSKRDAPRRGRDEMMEEEEKGE